MNSAPIETSATAWVAPFTTPVNGTLLESQFVTYPTGNPSSLRAAAAMGRQQQNLATFGEEFLQEVENQLNQDMQAQANAADDMSLGSLSTHTRPNNQIVIQNTDAVMRRPRLTGGDAAGRERFDRAMGADALGETRQRMSEEIRARNRRRALIAARMANTERSQAEIAEDIVQQLNANVTPEEAQDAADALSYTGVVSLGSMTMG